MKLRVLSYNIHKGVNTFGNKLTIEQMREAIRSVDADLVFLQEVQASSFKKSKKYETWPEQETYEYLADTIWEYYSYAKNSVYDDGHHGNVILSKFPIEHWFKKDISTNALEQRGVLGCQILLDPENDSNKKLNLFCVHLNLLHKSRLKQYEQIIQIIDEHCPDEGPLILAGDFNDWNIGAREDLQHPLKLKESFHYKHGKFAKTFPAFMPLLSLDRIYYRGLEVESAKVLKESPWNKMSDHAALFSEFNLEL